jgi:hypothetical protein
MKDRARRSFAWLISASGKSALFAALALLFLARLGLERWRDGGGDWIGPALAASSVLLSGLVLLALFVLAVGRTLAKGETD